MSRKCFYQMKTRDGSVPTPYRYVTTGETRELNRTAMGETILGLMMKQHGESESPCGELFVSLGGVKTFWLISVVLRARRTNRFKWDPRIPTFSTLLTFFQYHRNLSWFQNHILRLDEKSIYIYFSSLLKGFTSVHVEGSEGGRVGVGISFY